jgi:glycosyltransferase involved in cell wall biosynthesis
MKVLWFTNTPCSAADILGIASPFGGWLRSLEEALNESGKIELSICFYTSRKHGDFMLGKTMYYPVTRQRSPLFAARVARRLRNVLDDEAEVSQLRHVISKCSPDLIHVHGTEENFGLIQQHVSIPVVVSLQGILRAYEEKFNAGVPRSAVNAHDRITDRLAFSGYSYSFRNFRKRAARERTILKKSQTVIGRTEWDRRLTGLLAPGAKYHRCDELMRPAFYARIWNRQRFNTPLKIFTTSGNSLYKGFEMIVQSARVMKGLGIPFAWQVAGLAEKDPLPVLVVKWLKADLRDLGISLIGPQEAERLSELLCEADVYCQTSHIENSPNSLCEAMLTGMPVVASNCGGTPSLISDGIHGMLYPTGEAHACAAALLAMTRDFAVASEMGRAARDAALQRHNRTKVVHDLIEIYRSATAKH